MTKTSEKVDAAKLLELGIKFRDHFREFEATQSEVDMHRYQALMFIYTQKNPLATTLATFLNVSTPAATIMLDKFEKAGLIIRTHDSQDRRKLNLSLSKTGKALFLKIKKEMEAEMEAIFSGISQTEMAMYTKIQEKIIANMEKISSKRRASLTARP